MARPSTNQQLTKAIEQMNIAARMQDPLCYHSAEEVANWFLNSPSRKLIDYAREFGLIKYKKIGQEYRYNRQMVDDFLNLVGDHELKNKEDCKKIAEKIKKVTVAAVTQD